MTRPKMKLTVIFLFLLSGLAPLATASPQTICSAIRQHRFKDMRLLSITWNYFSTKLFLFTEPGFRYYEVPRDKFTYGSMDISQASPLNMAEDAIYKGAFASSLDDTHRGTYIFSIYYFWHLSSFNWKHVFLIVTDKGARSGSYKISMKFPKEGFVEVTEPEGKALPDFSLAAHSYDRSADLPGFILSTDSIRFPGYVMLSEFKVEWEGSKVTHLPPPKGQTDHRQGFFIQVADSAYDVILFPSTGNKPDPEAQLFRSLPRAFLYKSHLVMFDTATGCVHIIADFQGHFNPGYVYPRLFKRDNYPFEVYFKCGSPMDNPNPYRCHIVRGNHTTTAPPYAPTNTSEIPEDSTTESVDSFSNGATASVALVVAVLAVGLIYAIIAKKKQGNLTKGKSAPGKSATSSSAVSGTSKRRGKSTVGKSTISGHGAKSKTTLNRSKSRNGSKTSLSK